MRSTVRPKHSPWRMPVPAASTTRAWYRSGIAVRSASMAAVSRGTISLGCFFGSFVFSQGEALTRRSRIAAL